MLRVMTWATSDRRSRLPGDWPHRRAVVLKRDPTCKLRYPGICTSVSTEADHVHAGDDHQLSNLQGACSPCHAHKSALEGAAAKHPRKRQAKPHPGLR